MLTPDLRIDGVVADSNFPFVFFPQMFASLMISMNKTLYENYEEEIEKIATMFDICLSMMIFDRHLQRQFNKEEK